MGLNSGGEEAQKRAALITEGFAKARREGEERAALITEGFAKARREGEERAALIAEGLSAAIKGGGEVDLTSLDFSQLRDKSLGNENIIYDFQKIPVTLGDKGFPEPVDLTEEIFPYLKNLKTNPLNSDIPPNFSK